MPIYLTKTGSPVITRLALPLWRCRALSKLFNLRLSSFICTVRIISKSVVVRIKRSNDIKCLGYTTAD